MSVNDPELLLRHLSVLRWAAGAEIAPESLREPSVLVEKLVHHRLEGRAQRRLGELSPSTAGLKELRTVLEERFAHIRDGARRQLSAAVEIDAAWGGAENRPVVLKGNSSHVLSGDVARLRKSGDIDLICGDPDKLRGILPDLGWVEIAQFPDGHAMAIFERDGVFLDLHRFSPVCWISSSEGAEGPSFRHDGQIPYELFAAHHTRRPVEGEGWATVPTPTLAALISCANVFKDYALGGFPRRVATARLAFLAEVVEFAAHPEFSAEEFTKLAHITRAEPSIDLVVSLLRHHGLPVAPVLSAVADPRTPRLRSLCLGFSFTDTTEYADERLMDDLVVRRSSFGDFLSCLKPGAVSAGTTELSAHSTTLPLGGSSVDTRFRRGVVGFDFRFFNSSKGLRVDMEAESAGLSFEIVIDVGDHCVWGVRGERRQLLAAKLYERLSKTHGKPILDVSAEIHEEGGVSRFSVDIPRSAFSGVIVAGRLPAVIGFRRYDEENSAVAIPLHISQVIGCQ